MVEDEKRPKWTKPKLIVLVRGEPEEAVLINCKTATKGGTGNAALNSGCKYTTSVVCDSTCSAPVGS
jgi:hypothetical protein